MSPPGPTSILLPRPPPEAPRLAPDPDPEGEEPAGVLSALGEALLSPLASADRLRSVLLG